MKCAVVKCNKSNYGKASACSFFRFPTDDKLRKKWMSFCGRKKFDANSFVCMHHFKAEDFENNLKYEMGFAKRRLLKDGVVPTINMASIKNVKLHEQRSSRIERRENKKSVKLLLENHKSDLIIPSQENDTLQLIENTDTIQNSVRIIRITDKFVNIDIKIESHEPEKHS